MSDERLKEIEEKLEECQRDKTKLHNRINQYLTNIDSIEDDLSKCRTEKNVLLARIRNLERKVPEKPKIMMLGQEIDLEKLKEEEEEKPYWRTLKAREQAEAAPSLPEGFTNPWAHVDWDYIISDDRGVPVLERQSDLMEQYISEDKPPKKKVGMEELNKFRMLIDELKTYPPKTPKIYNRLMQIHSELNRIVRVLEKMHK